LDESQAPNYNTPTQSSQKKISLVDFINSNDQNALNNLITTTQNNANSGTPSNIVNTVNTANTLDSINLVTQSVNSQKISLISFLNQQKNRSINITNVPYPRFPEGKPYFTILSDVQNDKNKLAGVMIDGVPVKKGCQGSSFQYGGVYDFYIINFTMDDHPIHIHLVNFQIIRRFKFQVQKYKDEW
jgi:FtsP/CotA-like multicopper oxidase with cupredoxin domain